MLLPLLLLACASPPATPAARYSQAMADPDYDRAFALCVGIGSFENDCQTAVIERFKRYEDCPRLAAPGECEFRHAEEVAEIDPVQGVAACKRAAPYVPDCDEHMLGLLATHAETLDAAEDLFRRVEPDLQMPSARGHFLRVWFRGQLNAGRTPDASGCVDAVCAAAASHEIATFEGSRTPNQRPPRRPPGIGASDAP